MFTITDQAVEKVKEVLSAEGKEDWGLRIFITGSGCCGPSYAMDIDENPADGDEVVEKNGLRVFAEGHVFEKLKDMRMDFIDDGQNQGFVIQMANPDGSAPSCGCSGGTCK